MNYHILQRLILPAAALALAWPASAQQTAQDVMALTRQERAALTSLTLTGDVTPEVLTIIRDEMVKLRTLKLEGTTMTEIPAFAFAGKSALVNVTLPDGLTTIGDGAFMTCVKITKLTIPSTVTTVGKLAFADTGLGTLTIGSGVTSLGNNFIFNCDKLKTITVEEGNTAYCTVSGALYTADKSRLIKRPSKATGELTFPAELKTIDAHACANCTTMPLPVLPEGLTAIGDYAFQNCKAMTGTLEIPASVTSLGKGAFMGCIGLTGTVKVPSTVTLGGAHVFSYLSGVTGIELPENMTAIPASTFELCQGVKAIASHAAVPPTVGTMAMRGIDRNFTYIDVADEARSAYQSAPVWSEFDNYSYLMEPFTLFSKGGDYRIKYIGEGPANGKYITFTSDNTAANLSANQASAPLWHLEFFTVNHNNLPFAGEQGSDIYFIEGTRLKHINMAGLCWNDPAANYANNANRTFGFYLEQPDYNEAEGPVVAIVGNGTIWRANDDGTRLAAPAFSGKYPSRADFLWQLEPDPSNAISNVEAETSAKPAVYDLSGRRVEGTPAPGIYIQAWPDGKTAKVKF